MIRAIFLCLFCLTQVQAAPKLRFESTTYDFGSTGRVPQVTGHFTYRNDGDSELRVEVAHTSCACTRAVARPAALKTGETGTLAFSINIGPSVGTIVESIFVTSNDLTSPALTLTTRLYVEPIFDVRPPVFQLGRLLPGASTNLTVLIHRTDGQKLRITEVLSGTRKLKTQVHPVRGATPPTTRLVIQYVAGNAAGKFEDTLAVHTGEMYAEDIPKPSFQIPVTGEIRR